MSDVPQIAQQIQSQSPGIGQLAAALALAQGQFEAAAKDRNNPIFGSRYATLSSVWDACRDGLAKNGLAVVQQVSRAQSGEVSVRTVLAHASGEWMSSVITLPVLPTKKKDGTEMPVTAQSYGSAITYGRRYGLAAIVGIAPDDDDDGNGASRHEPRSPPAPPPAPSTAALKSKLAAKLPPNAPEAMSPLEKMLAHGKEHGLSDAQTKAAIKAALGKPQVNPSELTDSDVFTVAKHLQMERESAQQ